MSNIRLLRKKHGQSQEELAKAMNVHQTAVSQWENGKTNPDIAQTVKLAQHFGVTTDYLLGMQDIPLPSNAIPVNGFVSFQIIGSIAAGYNGAAVEDYTGEIIKLPDYMVPAYPDEQYFVLRVKGDSMYPQFLDGDLVLVHRCTSVDSGSIAVVIYNTSEATLKKVSYVYGEDWMELHPINPEYKTKRVEGAELELCRVLGKVVKLIRDI